MSDAQLLPCHRWEILGELEHRLTSNLVMGIIDGCLPCPSSLTSGLSKPDCSISPKEMC